MITEKEPQTGFPTAACHVGIFGGLSKFACPVNLPELNFSLTIIKLMKIMVKSVKRPETVTPEACQCEHDLLNVLR